MAQLVTVDCLGSPEGAEAAQVGATDSCDDRASVCSGNVCWHTRTVYRYPPTAHVIVHPDTWRWGPRVVIREHAGRGYWSGDAWTPF